MPELIVISEVKLPAALDHLREFLDAAASCAHAHGFTAERVGEVELVIEEAFVNIASYAYEGQPPGTAEMVIKVDEAGDLHVELIDEGVPFDSTAVAEPDLEADIDNRKIGGLGIFFMKQLMDDVSYSREDGKNILRFTVARTA
ncbi:ATP-binding protein [Candidatus Magnetominusculus xianensis]|nr:ATP-binding protein [Candidatus Magnetominusculus xianensis]MBF0403411.1 ATP-binding protein [Nitrospirota bacterium]